MADLLSERTSKLFQILDAKSAKRDKFRLCDWEPLLDAFFGFYDICCNLDAQKRDKAVNNFVRKYGPQMEEIRSLRVNKKDFDVVRTIGRGHFGEVCVVTEKGTKDVYAMKILKKSSTLSNDNIAFYEEERDIMAFGQNDWLVTLKYAFQDTENLYLVMEFLPGGDLLTLINKFDDGLMEEESARFYIAEISVAVHAVHVLGFVHRDVKPENILIDYTGHVKLADFGSAAKLVGGKSVLCKMPVGTPEYIAPEVLQSMNTGGGIYGCECDWWSVGVLCYEMMCGCLPFEADGVLKLYSQIMDFKNTLEFPDDVTIGADSRGLVLRLLEEQKARMKFDELSEHPFFKSIDLTALHSITPPHIPQVKDPLDTSNFNDVRPNKSTLNSNVAPSLGTTLPFLGFTFTKNLVNALSDSKTANSSTLQTNDNDDSQKEKSRSKDLNSQVAEQVESKNKEITENIKRIKKLEGDYQVLSDEIKQKDCMLIDWKQKYEKLFSEKEVIERERTQTEQTLRNLEADKSNADSLASLLQRERATVEALFKEKELLKSKVASLTNDLEASIKRCKDSETYWKEFEKIQAKSQEELTNSITELQNLLGDTIADYKEKLRISSEESKAYRDSAFTLENQLKNLRVEKEKVVEQIETGVISGLKSKLSEEHKRFEDLQAKIQSYQNVIEQKDSALESDKILILKHNQTIRNLENLVDQANSKIRDVENSVLDALSKADLYKQKCNDLVAENIAVKITSASYQKGCAELTETVNKLEQLLSAEKTCNQNLINSSTQKSDEIKSLYEEKCSEFSSLELQIKELSSKNSALIDEVSKLESELSKVNSVVSAQKTSNFALSRDLETTNQSIKQLTLENEELNSKISSQLASHKEQIYRFEATIAQQTKLINFLHADQPKKKGAKQATFELHPSVKLTSDKKSIIKKDRDVEQQLERERAQTMKLNKELTKLRAELKELKDKFKNNRKNDNGSLTLPETLGKDSEACSLDSIIDASIQKKDHFWYPSFCSIPNICFVCFNPIAHAKPIVVCTNCKTQCHADCQNDVPQFSCSLSSSFSDLYSLTSGTNLSKYHNDLDSLKPSLPYIGYLCVPNKVGNNKFDWLKRKFELTESDLIIRSDSDNEADVFGVIHFKKMEEKCKIRASVHTSDIFFTPVANAPRIFGIEINGKETSNFDLNMNSLTKEEQPQQNNTILYVFCNSLDEKRTWIKLLTQVVGDEMSESILISYKIPSSSIPNVNSIIAVSSEVFIASCSIGIVSFHTYDKSTHLLLEEKVECHNLFLFGDVLLAIVGEQRCLARLKTTKRKTIQETVSCKKSSLSILYLPIMECFSITTFSNNMSSPRFAATRTGEIVIFTLCDIVASNVVKITIADSMPSSLLFLDDNRLLILQDKIFVYDIRTNQKTEFLNSADHTLAFMIFGSSDKSNYPMNIFKLSRTSTLEYLICCSEFGLIVDHEGKRISNADIRWDDIPISFHFHKSYLYVCYASKIEVRDFSIKSLDRLKPNTFIKYICISSPLLCAGQVDANIFFANLSIFHQKNISIYQLNINYDLVKHSPTPSAASSDNELVKKTSYRKQKSIFYRNKK